MIKNMEKKPRTKKDPSLLRSVFIEEYLTNGFNGVQAAISAGYSQATARSKACQILREPAVAAKVEEFRKELAKKYNITKEGIIVDYMSVLTQCMQSDNPKDRNNALMALRDLSKLAGVLEDAGNKTENITINYNSPSKPEEK